MPYSEDSLLDIIDHFFPCTHSSLLLGRGDDCAILPAHGPLCLSTDVFSENSHFRRAYFRPEEIGYKALAVNISDIAACGGRPLAFSLGLSLPPDMERVEIEALFSGMAGLARQYDLALSGGDLSRADSLQLCLTIWGDAPDTPFLRRGCQSGDCLFVLEPESALSPLIFSRPDFSRLGLARLGCELLEKYGRGIERDFPAACAAHLRPVPCVAQGRVLAELARDFPAARIHLMDMSDGLARDLPRLLGDTSGADIVLAPEILHPEILRYARKQNTPESWAVEYAVGGGEDYCLLGACAPHSVEQLRSRLPELHVLGLASDSGQIRLNGQIYASRGFDHFSQ